MDNSYYIKFQITCVRVFYCWTNFELNECAEGGVNDLTTKQDKDLNRYVRQVANFQRDVLDSSFLENLDDFSKHPEYKVIENLYSTEHTNLSPSDLMNHYLKRIEDQVKQRERNKQIAQKITAEPNPDQTDQQSLKKNSTFSNLFS